MLCEIPTKDNFALIAYLLMIPHLQTSYLADELVGIFLLISHDCLFKRQHLFDSKKCQLYFPIFGSCKVQTGGLVASGIEDIS